MLPGLRVLVVAALTVSAGTLAAQAGPPPANPLSPPPPPPPADTVAAAPKAPPTPPYLATREEALRIGRDATQQVYTAAIDALLRHADPVDGDTASLRVRLTEIVPRLGTQLGAERRMVREQVMKVGEGIEYWRTAEYEGFPMPLIFRVVMGAQGKWRSFITTLEAQAPAGEEVLP